MRTWLTERFGMSAPLVGAPMAGVSGGLLAQAISAAGGLGCIGVGSATDVSWVTEQAGIARAGGRPFGVGLMAWALRDRPELLAVTIEERPALASVSFGDYRVALERLRENGIAATTQVGTLDEALAAEQAGAEFVVVRGSEGGGHGRGDVATLPLLQEVLDRVSVPVLAAGGVATGRGLAAVLAAGAAGAWVGTPFIACPEALTRPTAVDRVLAAGSTDTVYGTVFDRASRSGWPERYGGRALRNEFFDDWVGREPDVALAAGIPEQLRRAVADGDYRTAPLYAGQSVGTVTSRRAAADVVADLVGGARSHLVAAAALLEQP